MIVHIQEHTSGCGTRTTWSHKLLSGYLFLLCLFRNVFVMTTVITI